MVEFDQFKKTKKRAARRYQRQAAEHEKAVSPTVAFSRPYYTRFAA